MKPKRKLPSKASLSSLSLLATYAQLTTMTSELPFPIPLPAGVDPKKPQALVSPHFPLLRLSNADPPLFTV